jgi:hypothetical protein
MRFVPLALSAFALACDIDGRTLVQGWDPEAGAFRPVDVIDLDDLPDDERPDVDTGTYLGELGASYPGDGDISGATLSFEGTGDRVCVLIDPQSVLHDDRMIDPSGAEGPNPLMQDFPADDGDLDMLAGLASYYTGTPGAVMGDFVNEVVDDNGVARRVDLNLCLQRDDDGQPGGSAGRATPEACSFETLEAVPYRIALYVFSVPVDDDRLKYALEVRAGECPAVIDECTLLGDRDNADGLPHDAGNVEDMYCGR